MRNLMISNNIRLTAVTIDDVAAIEEWFNNVEFLRNYDYTAAVPKTHKKVVEIIEGFEKGINEPVMERGSTFSSGQRQLLSFARAIAHNPSILVLDEATSNIDTETEILIQNAIDNMAKERTTLIIAHRLSTIRNADIIIVLKNGEILEIGNHESLMEIGGYYKDLIVKK